MLNEYEEKRNEIRLKMIKTKDFQVSKLLCKNYISSLNTLNKCIEDTKEDFWFGYYNWALSDKKMGNIRESYINSQKSIQYTEFDVDDYHYLYSLWLVGECSLQLGKTKEAIKYFKECTRICISKNDFNFKTLFLFNIALAYKSSKSMLRIIKRYENNTYDITLPTYGDMQKDEILEEMYKELFKLYKNNNRTESIYRTLHMIKHKMVKKELIKLLVA